MTKRAALQLFRKMIGQPLNEKDRLKQHVKLFFKMSKLGVKLDHVKLLEILEKVAPNIMKNSQLGKRKKRLKFSPRNRFCMGCDDEVLIKAGYVLKYRLPHTCKNPPPALIIYVKTKKTR